MRADSLIYDTFFNGTNVECENADVIEELMITFAKFHVTAALKEALDSIPCLGSSSDIPTYEEVENEVLNSYPLTKII